MIAPPIGNCPLLHCARLHVCVNCSHFFESGARMLSLRLVWCRTLAFSLCQGGYVFIRAHLFVDWLLSLFAGLHYKLQKLFL